MRQDIKSQRFCTTEYWNNREFVKLDIKQQSLFVWMNVKIIENLRSWI